MTGGADTGEVDIYRDTPLRYLGYANEVGESFRSIVNVRWVIMSYVVASGYVVADAASKALKARRTAVFENKNVAAFKTGLDALIWQGFASVIIPGFTINRICAGSRYLLKKAEVASPITKWATVAIGLASIPFIIHPIDNAVTFGMDKTVRKIIPPK